MEWIIAGSLVLYLVITACSCYISYVTHMVEVEEDPEEDFPNPWQLYMNAATQRPPYSWPLERRRREEVDWRHEGF
jgi:hypothetical protein